MLRLDTANMGSLPLSFAISILMALSCSREKIMARLQSGCALVIEHARAATLLDNDTKLSHTLSCE